MVCVVQRWCTSRQGCHQFPWEAHPPTQMLIFLFGARKLRFAYAAPLPPPSPPLLEGVCFFLGYGRSSDKEGGRVAPA